MDVLSVSELVGYLNAVVDSDPLLTDVWVEGEVSNCKRHSSGHWYLTIKDQETHLDAACWRSYAARLTTLPRDGMVILAHGKIGIYNGRVQLYIDALRPAGEGLLQAQFERLRAQLEAEGLFGRKRELPPFPRTIGVVTSPTGAALRDMVNVMRRRFPLARLVVAPALVQGAGAAESIAEALRSLYAQPPDVIILARGGGSIEDLWCFNEELVARTLYAAPVPVITGVGHETDTTIVDFVADLRAPTPSAAAELATPELAQLQQNLGDARLRLELTIRALLDASATDLAEAKRQLERSSPTAHLSQQRERIDRLMERATLRLAEQLRLRKLQVAAQARSLRALNPEATLARGFAVVYDAQGALVTAAAAVKPGAQLTIQLRDGTLAATADGPAEEAP